MVEIKVAMSTIGSAAASIVIAILNQVTTNASMLGAIPAWLQFVLIVVIPPLVTWLGGYAMPSPTSSVSKGFNK